MSSNKKSPESDTSSAASPLVAIADAIDAESLPPVESWAPERRGDIDIRIAADGTWWHEGSPIRRERLVALFASVLRHDEDGYWLVTPVEMLKIEVEDLPFIANEMTIEGSGTDRKIAFGLRSGGHVIIGPDHPVGLDVNGLPYVHVRGRLDARISRPVWYRLAELADGADDVPILHAGGAAFPLTPAA
ncbi:MAG: DUF1285 domain-containing protein [Pacificimonas sp.]